MSRPIAYNTPALAVNGSITNEDKVISYVVDGRGNDYYNGYADRLWVPSADGAAPIVFVTDTYTRGYEGDPLLSVPLFFACAGTSSAAILYTANRLPGSPGNYTNANDALVDLNKTLGYFILESNDPFQGINATDMAMDLDASKMLSYPQTGVSWFDLSGNGNNGTLTNGPTFDSNGWLVFDGVDDWVQLSSLALSTTAYTKVAWFNPDGATNNIISGGGDGQHAFWMGGTATNLQAGHNGAWSTVNYSPGTMTGRWWFGAVTFNTSTGWVLYLNGSVVDTNASTTTFTGGTTVRIAAFNNASNLFDGKIAGAQVYNRVLSDAEVKQNYFGSPIVTDGLVFAVDANNIVSYPKSGTAWYGLTGSFSGSLTNGPTFSPANGGSIVFDGADDFISTNLTQTFTSELTVETWYRGTKLTRNHLWNFYGGNLGCNFNDSGRTLWMYWEGGGGNAIRFTSPNFTDNNIHHLVFRHSGSVNQIYFDGQLLTPLETLGTQTFTGVGGSGYAIGDSPAFGGNVYTNRVYNKALSAAEILQNYQAEQYRFETPAGPVTNGLLLYWDAGNLDSYPGTGTTIYDLSGNGNNGILYNGVGFNQTNGGVLIFDGVDDYVGTNSPSLPSTNNTVMGAARYSGGTRGRMINATSNNWLVGHWNNSTENYYAEGWVSTPGPSGPSDTNWRIYSALGDVSGDSYSLYVNNSLSAGPNNGGSQGPAGITVGKIGYTNSEYSTGEFGFVLVYNRVLTTAEMTQNYNFFKGRFGL
jgi:hypothetical protein